MTKVMRTLMPSFNIFTLLSSAEGEKKRGKRIITKTKSNLL